MIQKLAHAASAGMCEFELIEIAQNTASDPRAKYLQIPMYGNRLARLEVPPIGRDLNIDDYEEGAVLIPFNGSDEHWKFLSNPANGGFAMSCYNSIVAYKKSAGGSA